MNRDDLDSRISSQGFKKSCYNSCSEVKIYIYIYLGIIYLGKYIYIFGNTTE